MFPTDAKVQFSPLPVLISGKYLITFHDTGTLDGIEKTVDRIPCTETAFEGSFFPSFPG